MNYSFTLRALAVAQPVLVMNKSHRYLPKLSTSQTLQYPIRSFASLNKFNQKWKNDKKGTIISTTEDFFIPITFL